MRSDVQPKRVANELGVPWDLTEWFAPALLCQWLQEEVETLDWSNPEVVEYLRTHPAYQPKVLLCLLTFAYATGVYESEEIVRRSESEESFRSLCGRHAPSSDKALIRFRRENRGLLKWSLTQLFKRALKARLGELRLPAGLKGRLLDAAVTRLGMARQMDRGSDGLCGL